MTDVAYLVISLALCFQKQHHIDLKRTELRVMIALATIMFIAKSSIIQVVDVTLEFEMYGFKFKHNNLSWFRTVFVDLAILVVSVVYLGYLKQADMSMMGNKL